MLPYDTDKYQGIIEDNNKFLTYVKGPFEFRCSWRLSGMSLEKWSRNCEHEKKVGLYDYDKVIYQDQELTEEEQTYDRFDLLAMRDALIKQLKYFGDDITSIPLTKTGYIRRTLRRSCIADKYYRKHYFWDTRLDAVCYEYCLKSFAGGYTHNNRFYNNKIVRGLIGHRDFRSEYPSELRNYPFPTGKPRMIYDEADSLKSVHSYTVAEIFKLYPKYSSIIQMEVTFACLNDEKISMPFMQRSKMDILQEDFCLKDNGRILSFKGSAVITVDNLMFKILTEQYNMTFRFLKILTFKNS